MTTKGLLILVSIIMLSWQTDNHIYIELHAHPELAGKEIRTQATIEKYLKELGLKVETGLYGHSVIGMLQGGKPGKKIAWRAEMDALPVGDSAQHNCGHDVHMAIALGIASNLAKEKAKLHGTVFFIFQPEEETFVGAKAMVDHGLFNNIHPSEIYALHVTALPVGQIMVKPNEMFAYQKRIKIHLKKEVSKEEATTLSKAIYNKLSRSQPPDLQRIADPVVGLMNPNTIFKDYLIMDNFNIYTQKDGVCLETYLYETNKSNLQQIIPRIESIIGKDKVVAISYIQENPTVQNDPALTKAAIHTLAGQVVPDYGQVPYFNDDFAYFQQKVPGVYFLLGGSRFAMNHVPDFTIDEACIPTGIRSFSSLLRSRLTDNE